MGHLGNFIPAAIVRDSFNTSSTAGVPTTLAGSPTLAVYKDGGTTESTAGVTLTVDFDAKTGYHRFAIDTASDAAFYASGSQFSVVLAAGTVGGTSVVGVEVASFKIGMAVVPTLLVDGSLLAFGITDNGLAQAVAAASITLRSAFDGETNVVIGGTVMLSSGTNGKWQTGLVTAYNSSTKVATIAGGWSGALTPVGPSRYLLFATAVASGGGASLDAAAVRAALGMNSANMDTQLSNTYSRLGAPAGASVSADIAAVKGETAAIVDDTGTSGVVVAAGSKAGYSLSAAQTFNLTGNITGNLSGTVSGVTNPVTASQLLDKTNMELSSSGISAVLDATIAEPGSVPTWPMSIRKAMSWLSAVALNKQQVTASNNKLRNSTDTADIANAAQTDASGTYTRNKWI